MWPRICDIVLAVWLFFSRYIFAYPENFTIPRYSDTICAVAILLFSILSFHQKWNKMHLCSLLVACYLCIIAYLYPTPFLPFYLQSHLIVANILFMTAVIPSHASDSPKDWISYINEEDNKK